jgi:glycosyltransferase involved in cell wall biosynthesis
VVSGSGVNIKVVEYLDAGLPLVSTSLATQGLPLVAGADLEVHDDAAGFAEAILRLLADREAAGVMAKSGQAHIRDLLDPQANIALIASMLTA